MPTQKRVLWLIATAELLAMSLWFSGTLSCVAGGLVNNHTYRVTGSDLGLTTTDGIPLGLVDQAVYLGIVPVPFVPDAVRAVHLDKVRLWIGPV